MLLNFWATWCAPCIREMPALDRVQAALAGEGLEVVAVSQDFAGRKVVEPFFLRLGLAHLRIYYDTGGALSRALGVAGLPTTLLIDRQGRIVGGLEGPADWDSDESIDLIRHFLAHPETTYGGPRPRVGALFVTSSAGRGHPSAWLPRSTHGRVVALAKGP